MRLHPNFRLATLLGFVPLAAACTTPFQPPCVDTRLSASSDFPGISQLTASAPDRTLDVLMVHGMCTHGKEWGEHALHWLQSALKSTGEIKVERLTVDETKIDLYRATIPISAGTVRATALLWSPVVAPLKHQLCYDQSRKSGSCKEGSVADAYPHERAAFNRDLKDVLLDDCLADAIIYQGRSRDAISRQMQKAILLAVSAGDGHRDLAALAKDAAARTAPLVVITESLGSKMAFDAIYSLAMRGHDPITQAAGLQTLDRTTQVFMEANQIPMLALADQSLEGADFDAFEEDDQYPPDSLAALMAMRKKRASKPGVPIPRVIAFTDPNDLLSYTLVRAESAPYPVVDVIVSNAETYFGFLEIPDKAHIHYRENPSVLRIIAHGSSNNRCLQR